MNARNRRLTRAWAALFLVMVLRAQPVEAQVVDPLPPGASSSAASNQGVTVEPTAGMVVPSQPGVRDNESQVATAAPEASAPSSSGVTAIRRPVKSEGERSGSSFAMPAGGLGGLGSLALVLLAIVGLFLVLRRWVPGARASESGALRVVARAALSPRQHAALLHVGRRVLVVGVSNDRVHTLAEIKDADEVAELLARCGLNAAAMFDSLLDREQAAYAAETEDVPERDVVPGAAPRGAVRDLLRRVRTLQAK